MQSTPRARTSSSAATTAAAFPSAGVATSRTTAATAPTRPTAPAPSPPADVSHRPPSRRFRFVTAQGSSWKPWT